MIFVDTGAGSLRLSHKILTSLPLDVFSQRIENR
jgi:hypothetical protein